MKKICLSIVIYNEQDGLKKTLNKIFINNIKCFVKIKNEIVAKKYIINIIILID